MLVLDMTHYILRVLAQVAGETDEKIPLIANGISTVKSWFRSVSSKSPTSTMPFVNNYNSIGNQRELTANEPSPSVNGSNIVGKQQEIFTHFTG